MHSHKRQRIAKKEKIAAKRHKKSLTARKQKNAAERIHSIQGIGRQR
jgi:hypothetical protein